MDTAQPYMPHQLYARGASDTSATAAGSMPRVFIAPQRYIQGDGVLDDIGRYMTLVNADRVAILLSARCRSNEGERLIRGLATAGVEVVTATFGGECSQVAIDEHVRALAGSGVGAVVAIGGGKCVDAGKAIAHRLGVPVVIVPTLASNDAPCSALSVIYTPEGVTSGVEFYPHSPAMVVVDTGIVAAAPERFLVSGMGDAMATWYEARATMANPHGLSSIGARPTIASSAIGESCATTLYAHGVAAAAAVAAGSVTDSLELVVEANTLLSGLGFESGGLAAAHGVAQSCTAVPIVHDNHLHGEMVAFGVVTQLVMEASVMDGLADEARRVIDFFIEVGLPVHLGHLSLDPSDADAIDVITAGTLEFPMIGNMPIPVDAALVRDSLLTAHELGMAAVGARGDEAYSRLHTG
jgi:glycerol dehydrogenase